MPNIQDILALSNLPSERDDLNVQVVKRVKLEDATSQYLMA